MSNAIRQELSVFVEHLKQKTELHAGYSDNLTCDYTLLSKFFNHLLNNAENPFTEPDFGLHSRKFEQEVLAFFVDLYKITH